MRALQNKHFRLEEVKEGVYAAIAKKGTGAVANAGFIDLGDQTLIFDTFNTQQAAAELRLIAEKICPHPISYIINSHWHGDHIRGNQVFKDVPILSTEMTYNKMKATHPERILKQKSTRPELTAYIESLCNKKTDNFDVKRLQEINFLKEIEASLPDLELVLPSQTFTSEHQFIGTKRTAKVFTLGSSHSICDAMLYLPEEKVLFAGDLLFVDTHPSLFEDSDPFQWINSLDKVAQMDIVWAIPGHGPVGTRQNLTDQITYLKRLIGLASEPESIETMTIPESYQNWASPEIFTLNLKLLKEKLLVDL